MSEGNTQCHVESVDDTRKVQTGDKIVFLEVCTLIIDKSGDCQEDKITRLIAELRKFPTIAGIIYVHKSGDKKVTKSFRSLLLLYCNLFCEVMMANTLIVLTHTQLKGTDAVLQECKKVQKLFHEQLNGRWPLFPVLPLEAHPDFLSTHTIQQRKMILDYLACSPPNPTPFRCDHLDYSRSLFFPDKFRITCDNFSVLLDTLTDQAEQLA